MEESSHVKTTFTTHRDFHLRRDGQCHNSPLEVKVDVKEPLLEMSFQCLMKCMPAVRPYIHVK